MCGAKFQTMSSFYFSIIFIISQINFLIPSASTEEENTCSAFISIYQEQILGISVPTTPIIEVSQKYCNISHKTCCTGEVLDRLRDVSTNNYDKMVKKSLQNLSRGLKSKSSKFNEHFKDLLVKSKKEFHDMFKKTYGIVYEQNAYVFTNFFSELEKYFSYGKSNLADVLDTFFNILYQKMFTVMNSQFRFDDKYLGCVSEHMNDLKPFGDVPQKLSLPLKRSFIAARTYAQSLNLAGDIVSNLIAIMPEENCVIGLMKMLHCSSCNGLLDVKICGNYCVNVMKGCLAFYLEMESEWNNFVEALIKVQLRLLGPFNIELVVEPINVKISEAIMNFQESATQITNKVFNGCGKPPLLENAKRRRRQINEFSRSYDFSETNERRRTNERPGKKRKLKNESNSSPNANKRKGSRDDYNLDQYGSSPIDGFLKFIKEIGTYVASTKNYWRKLPHQICTNDTNTDFNENAVCWTGEGMSHNTSIIESTSVKNSKASGIKHYSTITNEQIFSLKSITSQLKNAHLGLDVEWIDSEEAFDVGSGSGFIPDAEQTENSDSGIEGSGEPPSPAITKTKTETSSELIDSTAIYHVNISDINTGEPTSSSTAIIDEDKYKSSDTNTKISSTLSISSTTENINVNINKVNVTSSSGGTAVRYEKMSLNMAIASYLLPTVVIWIGGPFNDWFHTIVSGN